MTRTINTIQMNSHSMVETGSTMGGSFENTHLRPGAAARDTLQVGLHAPFPACLTHRRVNAMEFAESAIPHVSPESTA